MNYILTVLLLAVPALCLHFREVYPIEPEYIEHENTFIVERITHYLPCPARAVCAIAHDFNRLTRRGRYVPERRIIHQCHCHHSECPIVPEHRLYASIKTREYFCEPVSTLRPCNLTDFRSPAKEMVEGSELFDFFAYFRVNCICPRHRSPQVVGRRGMELATSFRRIRPDIPRNMIYHHRICRVRPSDLL